jgi:hypothetical protein
LRVASRLEEPRAGRARPAGRASRPAGNRRMPASTADGGSPGDEQYSACDVEDRRPPGQPGPRPGPGGL